MMPDMAPLWRYVKLGRCLHRRKDTVLPATLTGESVGLVGLEDMQDSGHGGIMIQQTIPQKIQSLKTRFKGGDILYGKLRPNLNKVGIAPDAGLCSTEIWAFSSSILVDSRFATFFLASSFFVDRVASFTKGANLPRLDTDSFDSIEIPLPPLSEQRRIVEILQEVEEIRHLQAKAEDKTSQLVPAMFEGVFGDPVFNKHKWAIEPLSGLINDTPKNGLYKPASLYGEGTPIIRIGDFTAGILRTGRNLQRVRISDEEIEQFGVCNGQILINRVNSIEHLGKSLLVTSLTEPTVYESNMMRLDPKKEKVLPEYLIACLQHESIVAKLRTKAKKAINQASINQTDVLTLQIPVPPLKAQLDFLSQVAHAEELRAYGDESMKIERALSTALAAHAFSGQLTAGWREAHQDILALEASDRDAALKEEGAALTVPRRATIQELEDIVELPTSGSYAELNSEQRFLLSEIGRMVGGVRYARYFSAQTLSEYIPKGVLRRNPQAIEGHLAVLAARGLVIPVSREEQTEDTGVFIFGNAYRLPLQDNEQLLTTENGDGILTEAGEELNVQEGGDQVRLSEMERLAAQLEKERSFR